MDAKELARGRALGGAALAEWLWLNAEELITTAERATTQRQLLVEIEAHLDYCGWGDQWERQGAIDANLPTRLADAIGATK